MKNRNFMQRFAALALAFFLLFGPAATHEKAFSEEGTFYSDWLTPPKEEAAPQEITAGGEDYFFRVQGALPEGAELSALETEAPEGFAAIASEALSAAEEDILSLRVFDLSLLVDGQEIQPEGPVRVFLEMDVPGEKTAVLHLKSAMPPQAQGPRRANARSAAARKGFEAESLPVSEKDGVIEFETGGFSLYAVVGYRLEKTVIASDGIAYRITVTYGDEAGIPEGAGLETAEVDEGDPAYLEYLRRAAEAMGASGKDLTHLRLFDIHILSPEGEPLQPLAPVKVTIAYDDPLSVSADQVLRVVHLLADGSEEVMTPDVKMNADGLAEAFVFNADGFSMYAVVSSGDMADLDGKTVALINPISGNALQDTAHSTSGRLQAEPVSVSGDGLYLGSEDNDLTLWTFRSAGNGKYFIQNAAGQYLNIGTGTNTVSVSGTAQAFNVTAGTGSREGMFRIYTDNRNRTLYNPTGATSQGFATTVDATTMVSDNAWFKAYEVNKLGGPYEGQKIGVGEIQETGNPKVLIYRSVYNAADDAYEDFVIDGMGNLVRAYDKGNHLTLYSRYSPVWSVIFHRDEATGELNGYYDFYNESTGMYLCPRGDGTLVSSTRPGVTLNGRRDGQYNSTIESWDTSTWAWYGYEIGTEGGVTLGTGTGADSQAFSFASVENHAAFHPVNTVDSQAAGITIRMYDFNSREQITAVVGGGSWNAGLGYEHSGLASKTLDGSGFPTFAGSHSLGELFNGTYSKGTANHLFLQSVYNSTGYYEYNSFNNYAYYQNGNFTVYQEIGTPGDSSAAEMNFYQRGNFLPYNAITNASLATQSTNAYDSSGNPLPFIDPTNGAPIYKINNVNYFFGMSMDFNFMQPRAGYNQGQPMIYEFNGDDDLWVYIDNVLVLDIGGVHDALPGTINFATGEIHYAKSSNNTTIKECFREAGVFPDGSPWDESRVNEYFRGETFIDYSSHKFNMFYMEHGRGASNLEMRFNLPVIEKGKVTVEKVLEGTNQQRFSNVSFAYQAFKASGDTRDPDHDEPMTGAVYEGTSTPLTFYNNVTIGGKTYNNVFYLKPGEAAVFPEMQENTKYWVRELGVGSSYYDVIVNDVQIDGEDVTAVDGVYPTTVATVYNRARVTYANQCAEANHNELRITKRLGEGMTDDGSTFEFRVLLENASGALAPYSTGPYMIRNDAGEYFHYVNGVLTSNGMSPIQASVAGNNGTIAGIPPGYTVVIDGLLAGTDFYVEEIRNPGGWKLESKEVTDCDPSTVTGTAFDLSTVTADGQIALGLDAKEVFTNRKPVPVETTIGGFKILNGRAMKNGEFTFSLVRIDREGNEITSAVLTSASAGADGQSVPFAFYPAMTFTVEDYLAAEKDADGAVRYYYVVSEVVSQNADENGFDAEAQIIYDLNRYLVELVLTYDENHGLLQVQQNISLYEGGPVPAPQTNPSNA